ncbi:hypothetical protein OpiT1DRAFT_05442 [Opitutaceae bacterium TAV1]|nr:hypothetical protein OpiT1DRAFT_05442 [Opitutaceae bacterium TAV1]
MNRTEKNGDLLTVVTGEGNIRPKRRRYRLSAQAKARMGRPAKYPEAKILSQRFEVSYSYAIKIVKGLVHSRILSAAVPAIRAELVAKQEATA